MSALRPEQIRDFRELGYFNAGRLFDDAALGEMRAEYDRILARSLKIGEKGRTPFDYSPLLHLQSPRLCQVATAPELVAIAVDLIGPDVRLYWDQAVFKRAGAESDVPWHQDNGYTPVVPLEYVTCTVALDAHTRESGCLWILPGSHKRGVVPHEPTDMVFYRGYDGPDTGVPVELGVGEVLVFSSLTMHRTGGNHSRGPRRSWVIQFCDADSKHRDTGVRFDDRLLVAKDGAPLPEPIRERALDLAAIVEAGRRRRPA
jgi:ectoine hydroxylase-related dioxygenase (phytanoyl-CoA dioxygenase family)